MHDDRTVHDAPTAQDPRTAQDPPTGPALRVRRAGADNADPSGAPAPAASSARSAASWQLRRVLVANAATSALGGMVAVVAPGQLDRLLGTGHVGWVRVVGAGLVAFAVLVAATSRAGVATLKAAAAQVSVADAVWVVGSVAAIADGWFSSAGEVAVGLVALVVAAFAAVQLTLRRRLR